MILLKASAGCKLQRTKIIHYVRFGTFHGAQVGAI